MSALFTTGAHAFDTFTWQGKLVDGGVAADGVYDLKFRLFDAAAGPAQVGGELIVDDVFVTEGLLTIDLDFGAGMFPGADRWLEIDLKADADGVYTTLSPRQPIHTTPYAMYAIDAAAAGSVADGGLPATYTGAVSFTNPANTFAGNGSGLTNLNATELAIGNVNVARMPTGGNWSLASNLNVDSNTLVVDAVNNRIGVGTPTPTSALHLVNGGPDIGLRLKSGGSWTAELRQTNSSLLSLVNGPSERLTIDAAGRTGINTMPTTGARFHVLESSNSQAYGIRSQHTATSGTTYGVYATNDSTTGRGVYAVAGAATGGTRGVYGEVHSQDGIGIQGYNSATTGPGHAGYFSSQSTTGTALYSTANSNSSGITVGVRGDSNSGQGIGVYGLAADDSGSNYGVYGESASFNGNGVRGEVTAPIGLTYGGWFTSASRNGTGIEGSCLDATDGFGGTGVKGFSNNSLGVGVLGRSQHDTGNTIGVKAIVDSPNGHAGYFQGGRNYFEGFIGVGTANPDEMLHLKSASSTIIRLEADTDNLIESHQPRIEMSQDGGVITGGIGFHDSSNHLSIRTFDAGTGTPNILLEAHGSTVVGSGNSHLGRFVVNQTIDNSSSGIGILNSTGARSGRLWVASNDVLRLDSNGSGTGSMALNAGGGNVGVGISLPAYLLHVNGTAAKPGGGSWTNSSDRRLKKNIEDLDGALDTLLALRGVTFEYKEPEKINELPGERIGMIAQEVEQVFPDWVEESGFGYKTVTFRGFEALTVEALRELRAEKDAQISERDRQIATMQNEIESLRAMVLNLVESNAQLENEE